MCISVSLGVCVFFFPPSFVLFGLSVTAVKRIPVPTAGRGSHSLNQPTRLHAHVLTCVNPCLCVSMWRWVVDASIHSGCHPSPSPIPHMSYDLSKNDERSPRVFFPLRPPALHPDVGFILSSFPRRAAGARVVYLTGRDMVKVIHQWKPQHFSVDLFFCVACGKQGALQLLSQRVNNVFN